MSVVKKERRITPYVRKRMEEEVKVVAEENNYIIR